MLEVEVQSFNDRQNVFRAVISEINNYVIHIDFYLKYGDTKKIPVWVHAVENSEDHKRCSGNDKYRNVFAGIVDQGKSNADSLRGAALEFFLEAIKCPYISEELQKEGASNPIEGKVVVRSEIL